jgi:hypothetical protein
MELIDKKIQFERRKLIQSPSAQSKVTATGAGKEAANVDLMDLSPKLGAIPAAALGMPVNKTRPHDMDRQQECVNLVKKLNADKKKRQKRLDEIQKKADDKLN